MPAQTGKMSLADKLGKRGEAAYNAHKADEITFSGGGDCPAGIEAGIAQLTDCRFSIIEAGKKNAGEFMFYAAGIVKQPKTFTDKQGNVIPTEGLRTFIMEPLCDTPDRSGRKTLDEHIAWTQNEMKKLGVDLSNIPFAQWETAAAAIKKAAPHFKFRTWKGAPTEQYPDPMTNHDWKGAVKDYKEADPTAAVKDNTMGTDPTKKPAPAPANKPAAKPTPPPAEPPADTSTAASGGGEEDLTALGEKAAGGDEVSAARISELAAEHGVADEAAKAESWQDSAAIVAAAMAKASGGEGSQEAAPAADEGDFVPKQGSVYKYKPPGKRKSVECEVTVVFAGKKTCNLKNLDDNSIYKSIPWDSLEEVA